MSVKMHYEVGGAIDNTALFTSRHLQCAVAYIPPRHASRAPRTFASSSATATSATARSSPDPKLLSRGYIRSRECVRNTLTYSRAVTRSATFLHTVDLWSIRALVYSSVTSCCMSTKDVGHATGKRKMMMAAKSTTEYLDHNASNE